LRRAEARVNVAGLDTSDLKEVKALLDVLAWKLFAQPARWKAAPTTKSLKQSGYPFRS
jgi:hypothetical protein